MTVAFTAPTPFSRQHLSPVVASAPFARDAPVRLDLTTLTAAYGEHNRAVYRLAYRILNDHFAAEDVVQDAFLKLWTGAAQYDPARGPILGLLLTIARHKAIDGMRKMARRRRSEDAGCVGETFVGDGPEQATERAEDAREVRRALLTIPRHQRQVIEMAYFDHLTCREIAAAIAVPAGTVKSRTRRGLQSLLADRRLRR